MLIKTFRSKYQRTKRKDYQKAGIATRTMKAPTTVQYLEALEEKLKGAK